MMREDKFIRDMCKGNGGDDTNTLLTFLFGIMTFVETLALGLEAAPAEFMVTTSRVLVVI